MSYEDVWHTLPEWEVEMLSARIDAFLPMILGGGGVVSAASGDGTVRDDAGRVIAETIVGDDLTALPGMGVG